MVKKIVVNQTPPGQAPQEIRDAWIGCEIPLATESDLAVDRPSDVRDGNQNEGGYRVLRMSAIVALRENGKAMAADYWDSLPLGRYLVFSRKVCSLIE